MDLDGMIRSFWRLQTISLDFSFLVPLNPQRLVFACDYPRGAEFSEHPFFCLGAPVPNLNSGKEWSDTDIEDLITALDHGLTVETTADFLCRDEAEVRERRSLA
jgi:hypothetical protein